MPPSATKPTETPGPDIDAISDITHKIVCPALTSCLEVPASLIARVVRHYDDTIAVSMTWPLSTLL